MGTYKSLWMYIMCIHIYAKVYGCTWMCMCVLNTCKDWYKQIYNTPFMYEGHWTRVGESPLLCVVVCHSCWFNSMCTLCTISIVHCVESTTHALIVLCHLLSGNCWVACSCALFPYSRTSVISFFMHCTRLWVHHLHGLYEIVCILFVQWYTPLNPCVL